MHRPSGRQTAKGASPDGRHCYLTAMPLPSSRPLSLLAVAALTALALLVAGCSDDDTDAAARVADQTISRPLLDAYARDLGSRTGLVGEPSAERMASLREEALRQLILNAQLHLEAKRRGITVGDEQVERALFEQAGEDPLAPEPTELERVQMRDRLVQEALREQLGADVPVPTQAQIAAFYRRNKALVARPASRAVVYLRAAERAPLARLAAQRADLAEAIGSEGLQGGAISYIAGSDRLVDALILEAGTGKLIGPVKDSTGAFALIQPREDLVPASEPTLAQAREQIAQLLRDQQIAEGFSALVSEASNRYRDQLEIAEDLRPSSAAGPSGTP